jgi:hypothetical protein
MAQGPRDRKELPVPGTRSTLPTVADLSKIDAVIADARAAVAERKQQPERGFTSPAPAPRVETVRVQAYCSTYGRPSVIIAERRGKMLRLVGNEPVQRGGNGKPPAKLSGAYEIDAAGWACPHCGRGTFWSCNCDAFHGVLHCTDGPDGLHHCACGNREERSFQDADRFEVRGRAGGSVVGGRSSPQALILSRRHGR